MPTPANKKVLYKLIPLHLIEQVIQYTTSSTYLHIFLTANGTTISLKRWWFQELPAGVIPKEGAVLGTNPNLSPTEGRTKVSKLDIPNAPNCRKTHATTQQTGIMCQVPRMGSRKYVSKHQDCRELHSTPLRRFPLQFCY